MATQIPHVDAEELSTAYIVFSELYDMSVSLKRNAAELNNPRRGELVIDISELDPDADPERFVNFECARYFWRSGCVAGRRDYQAALAKVGKPSFLQALIGDANLLDEFGLRVTLYERMQEEGCLEAFATEADIVEMDHFANSLAMRFCELDGWLEQNDDAKVDAYLQVWTDAVIDAFKRYVEVRSNVNFNISLGGINADASKGAILGPDVVGVTVGLEALTEHEEFSFLAELWKPAGQPTQGERSEMGHRVERIDEIKVALDTDELVWPSDFASASGNQQYEDLSAATWAEVDEVLKSESELLGELLEANPGRVLVDLGDDVDEIAYAELGVPTDFGTCAATLALNAAGCPTISACAGHVGGYPHIAFWARRSAKRMLIGAATTARIGLGNARYGAAEVFMNPDDALGMVRFAAALRDIARSPRRPKPVSGTTRSKQRPASRRKKGAVHLKSNGKGTSSRRKR